MAGEATKKEREHVDPNNPGRGQAPEVQQEDPNKQDPNKRNKPDQYNQGGGLPPTEQSSGKQGGQQSGQGQQGGQGKQTGHENPRSGSGQQGGQNQPHGGQQQGNQGNQRSGQNEGSDRGQQRNEGQQDRGRDNKTTSETDDRAVKQGQQKH
jgi:hypothetical protein